MDWLGDSDHASAERRRKEALIEHEARMDSVLKALAKSRDGRYFLRWILDESGFFTQEFSQDERAAQWIAGRRSLGAQVFQQCAAHGIAGMLMEKEISDV